MAVLRIEPLDDHDPQLGYTPLRQCDRCGEPRILVARVLERRPAGRAPAPVTILERDLCGDCAAAVSRREGEFADRPPGGAGRRRPTGRAPRPDDPTERPHA